MTDKKNAFDLLRIFLALFVLISHGYLLGGYKVPDPLFIFSKGQTSFGEIGVMGFFALSGYLITASFERAKSILVFASHRVLRIFPAYWVCLLICAFVFAPLIFCINGGHLSDFIFSGNSSSLSFVYENLFLKIRQWGVKNILAYSAYKESLNGNLWSLFPEALCYIFTIAAGYCGLFNKNKALYLILFIIVLCFFAINLNFTENLGSTIMVLRNAFKLYASYTAGSIIYVYRDYLKFDLKGTIFSLLFSLTLIKFGGFNLAAPLLIGIVLINGFQLFRVRFKYDISYGLYIYAFPVQQILFLLIATKLPVIVFNLLSFVITGVLAFLSFILIERPAMRLREKTDVILS
jgi:peptidoglycan/LPS O-acetylase OafA/YrhL